MDTRTYATASAYDFEYVALANALLPVLEDYNDFFEALGLDQFDLVELAVILVAYFEDCINEIGVWKAFVTHNEERFSYSLPFYELRDDYDTDYINPEDFSFLTWRWLMERFAQQKMFPSGGDPIINLGEELIALLNWAVYCARTDNAHQPPTSRAVASALCKPPTPRRPSPYYTRPRNPPKPSVHPHLLHYDLPKRILAMRPDLHHIGAF